MKTPNKGLGRIGVWGIAILLLNAAIALSWSEVGAQVIERWVAHYNGPFNFSDAAFHLALDASGNVYVTGQSDGLGTRADYATVKYDGATGTQLWVARYDKANRMDWPRGLAVDTAGNVYVTGGSEGVSGTPSALATIKYHGINGAQLWEARYSSPGSLSDEPWAKALAVDATGNVYVTGWSTRLAGMDVACDYITIKFDGATGAQRWVARYSGPGPNVATALKVDAAGNIFVTGWSGSGASALADYVTIKYNGVTGAQLWTTRYNAQTSFWDWAPTLDVDAKGDVYLVGSRSADTTRDYVTIKYDGAAGAQLWEAHYDGGVNAADAGRALAVDAKGDVYVTGWSIGGTGQEYATIKYKGATGEQLWVDRYHGPGTNIGNVATALALDVEGNVYVTGQSSAWVVGTGNVSAYATIKYEGMTGRQLWVASYGEPTAPLNYPTSLAVDPARCVYVTGMSEYPWDQGYIDYTTVKYCDKDPLIFSRGLNTGDWFGPIDTFCFDIPPASARGLPPVRSYGPQCPPPPDCPECSFATGWAPANQPSYMADMYREVRGSLRLDGEVRLTQRTAQRLASLFEKPPAGVHYTAAMKASLVRELSNAKGPGFLPLKLGAEVVRAINALELDWRVPPLSAVSVEPLKYSAVDFQGVALVAMRDIKEAGTVTLRVETDLPAAAVGFAPGWPIASYAFDFSGQLAKDGYVDVTIHINGIRFEGRPSALRILEWDGRLYKDVTTQVDPQRGIITGRATGLSTFVLMTAIDQRRVKATSD